MLPPDPRTTFAAECRPSPLPAFLVVQPAAKTEGELGSTDAEPVVDDIDRESAVAPCAIGRRPRPRRSRRYGPLRSSPDTRTGRTRRWRAGCCEERAASPRIRKPGSRGEKRALQEVDGRMPQKTATEWERTATESERAADEIDRAEWRLLDALEAGDEVAIVAAEDELALCQRRTGRLRPKRTARPVEQAPAGQRSWGNLGR